MSFPSTMKPRISFIIDRLYDELSGTERQLGRMIRGLADQFDIDLICLRESQWLHADGLTLPCTIRVFEIDSVKRPRTYLNIVRLIRYLRECKPAVVHTFFPVSNIVGVLCARLAGVVNIVSSRRDYGEWMTPHYLAATRFANRFVTHVITNSHQVKRLTVDVEHVPAERISVIYNGIDVGAFRRQESNLELKRSLQVPTENKVVGLIANYRPMKRQDTLVRAAQEIVAKRDDIDFVLVGRSAVPGDPRGAVERLAESLGLTRRVHFAHAEGNVKEFLSIMDVGVNCSEGEGLSNAIMEYMAYGVPCVVSASGGNPDLIEDGVTGRTFGLGDYHALALYILQVIDDREARTRFTRNAADKVRFEMSMETMVDRFSAFYRTVPQKSRGKGIGRLA